MFNFGQFFHHAPPVPQSFEKLYKCQSVAFHKPELESGGKSWVTAGAERDLTATCSLLAINSFGTLMYVPQTPYCSDFKLEFRADVLVLA
jgi:hypothetical protein